MDGGGERRGAVCYRAPHIGGSEAVLRIAPVCANIGAEEPRKWGLPGVRQQKSQNVRLIHVLLAAPTKGGV